MGPKKVPYIVTHDGRTIRFPHPEIQKNDSVKLNLKTGEIIGVYRFELGSQVMITGGNNIGRVGTISKVEKHEGSYEIIHVKDERGEEFSTRLSNVFVIGTKKPEISLLKRRQKFSIIEERNNRLGIKAGAEETK
jgi:small subunit ribosomal protein S4e